MSRPPTRPDPAVIVLLAGIAAALHVGKLAPAIPALQRALSLSLVEAGFLLSLVQLAGMAMGAVFGLLADGLGGRRSMTLGLVVLGIASGAGGMVSSAAPLMALRAAEGFGFLLVVLPAPGLLRRLVAPERLSAVLGLWGAYMPVATALALLTGPVAIEAFGWRAWWWVLALVSFAAAAAVTAFVHVAPAPARAPGGGWPRRLARTLGAPAPWLLALSFSVYSSQWLAVVGFLPTIYQQAGIAGAAVGALTALAAGVNALGNLAGGALLQRRVAAPRLLATGFATMALATFVAYADFGATPAWARYAAALAFSTVGGMVPATLFALAVQTAPGDDLIGTTVGWLQQWSAIGQFAGPPVVAWVASASGGWQRTWLVTGACSIAGLLLARAIAVLLEKKRYAAIPR